MNRIRVVLGFGRAAAVRSLARGLRPVGVIKGAIAAVTVVVVLGVAFLALGTVVSAFYGQYGFHPAENARSWAALTPSYASEALCQQCHQPEFGSWIASRHLTVACESCHGPLAAHAAETAPNAPAGTVVIATVPAGICVTCHAQVTGRPVTFPQVDPAAHYEGAACLWCHNPHDATAVRPPDIPHPLDRLPDCVTCHAPGGLKPVPVGHVASSDAICLTCHKRPTNGT